MSAPLLVLTGVTGSREMAIRCLAALREAGFGCAPLEPTEQMIDAGYDSASAENAAETWREMMAEALRE